MEKNKMIAIEVETEFLSRESQPEKHKYLFTYTIRIRNRGEQGARLLSRYWKITGGNGEEYEVTGDGVVGLHPFLAPDEEFCYTSAAILDTPVGMMQGHYKMVDETGEHFEVPIPAFTLSVPQTLH